MSDAATLYFCNFFDNNKWKRHETIGMSRGRKPRLRSGHTMAIKESETKAILQDGEYLREYK